MAVDKLQTSRFELKYIIQEEQALQIRDYVRSYLELDENGSIRVLPAERPPGGDRPPPR